MEVQAQISLFILLGVLTMICLALGVILFFSTYRKRILEKEAIIQVMNNEKQVAVFKAAIEAEENQKQRIANNLHDEIGTLLAVLSRNLEQHARRHKATGEGAMFESDRLLLSECINGIRAIYYDLMPPVFLSYGFVKALEHYVVQLNDGAAAVELENETSFANEIPFSNNQQINIYRACLEILHNLKKHAGYTYLRLRLDNSSDRLVISFIHNGKGVTNPEIERYTDTSRGLGLKSLKSRIIILNGVIDYAVETNKAVVTLTIPCNSYGTNN